MGRGGELSPSHREWEGERTGTGPRPDLLPALPRPQRPCPVKAPSPPPPGAERKGRRSPRTAPAATRSPSRLPAARGASRLPPQVSGPSRRRGQARGRPGCIRAQPRTGWCSWARTRGAAGLTSEGQVEPLKKAIWRFSQIRQCAVCVTVPEGMGASK